MKIGITFAALLYASAVGQAAYGEAPGTAKSAEDKVLCKRTATTGSLARVKKDCRTAREWREQREQAQRDGNSLQENAHIGTNLGSGG